MIHIFLDTETTGLGPFGTPGRHDQIIEVAMIWEVNGKLQYIQEFANPGMEYLRDSSEALMLQGRTIIDVLAYQDISIAATLVRAKIRDIKAEFHAWNIPFDRYFLEQGPWNLNLNWGEDPMVLASRYMGYSYDRIALRKASRYFQIRMPESYRFHNALADAYMAMKIYEAMK